MQQADRRKTEFLATLATTLALLERTHPTPASAQTHYTVMGRQLDHMGRLINDLMEISRVRRGKISLQIEGSVVPCIAVCGDSVRLAQVFANLLNNAAKYTMPGGRIELSAQRQGDIGLRHGA